MAAPMERLSGVCADLERWVRGQLEQGEPRGGVEVVQRLSELLREQVYREMTEERIFKLILQILSKASREIQTVGAGTVIPREKWLQLVAECFRCLRNSCVQCPQNQCVIRTVGLIDESVCLMKILSVSNLVQESCLVAFRCGLQFLGNTAAGNRDSQNRIWTCACPELFLSCLLHADEKVATYSSMVLFTCLESEKVVDLQDPDKLTVALNVIAAYRKQPDAEWLYLIVTDRFLKCPELVKAMYAKLSNQERITMLELIMATISEKDPLSEEESSSLQKIAEILAGFFQEQCKAVLRLASADDDEEALVVIRLLDVLCEMTSNNEHLECLQNIPCLLDTVVEILRLTHLAGKQSKNVFTAVHTMTLGEDLTHVAVGFKAHLIRIIGNLCYKNKENQDKIFQLEGIPLILDNCSIDDNNPFLNQWAMFAIRNLTEHNKRNQELIAKMERQGLADSSLLNSMGFQVEDRDGKLLLKSTKK
ncbi:ataxin-10 isoform X2 [Ascaphus truei]|uniref:ataxin-10 isoform X2 n=1 Tax=Ascaphus truei TaxID=8439 RepID=UPI003F59624E